MSKSYAGEYATARAASSAGTIMVSLLFIWVIHLHFKQASFCIPEASQAVSFSKCFNLRTPGLKSLRLYALYLTGRVCNIISYTQRKQYTQNVQFRWNLIFQLPSSQYFQQLQTHKHKNRIQENRCAACSLLPNINDCEGKDRCFKQLYS